MEKELPKGLKIVVKNVTGAGGGVGTTQLSRAKPDGYTEERLKHLREAGII
jgi:tripartite-type tricarboxylate transporter receptor subunit TctC